MIGNLLTTAARALHIISSGWVLVLAVVILVDVVGRSAFGRPLLGTSEIVKNSVVAITFLQIPLAIMIGAMLRTTFLVDAMGPRLRAGVEVFACLLGLIFFVVLAVGSFGPMTEAWRIGEYEGEGALRVPTYPVRAVIVVMAGMAALVLLWQITRILTGRKHTL